MIPDQMFQEDAPFFLITGPCALEGAGVDLRIGNALARLASDLQLPVIFKGSFDKANRSAPGAPRGLGLDEGLRGLEEVRAETGLPVLTDVHEPGQCAVVGAVVDVLQIPAFLCRQTDLLIAAAETGRPVNVKKGQWMSPEGMRGAAEKLRSTGCDALAMTERGTHFGYGDLVVDMRSFARMRAACRCPVVFDGTHSVQRPGGAGDRSGGDPGFIPALVRAAAAAGIDGLFLEVHPEPATAPSDATNMLPLDELEPLIRSVLSIREVLAAQGAHA